MKLEEGLQHRRSISSAALLCSKVDRYSNWIYLKWGFLTVKLGGLEDQSW